MSRFGPVAAGSDALRPATDPATARAVARAQLEAYGPADGTQGARRDHLVTVLDEQEDALLRSCRPGHLTGSALVVHADGERVLVLHHAKLDRWLQPGGHADGDGNLAHVAWREATEETGIDGLVVVTPAIDVDVHEVDPPAEDAHLHLDVRFVVLAPPDAVVVGNDESHELRWVHPDGLGDLGADDGLLRLVRRGLPVARGVLRRLVW